jgi:ethanolamine utilization protein EutN
MRIVKVIGNVVLCRAHPSLGAGRLRVAVPLTLAELASSVEPQAEPLVLWDDLGAGIGSLVAMAEGPEAARPFHPEIKPLDAYAAAILDTIDIDPDEAARIGK